MIIELDKKAMISLVMGEKPNIPIMDDITISDLGRYSDNRGWQWDTHALEKKSEDELYQIYLECRRSWKITYPQKDR